MSARVAIVEDDNNVRELLKRVLSGRGYEVEAYGSLASALEGFRAVTPDMIVLDARLPDGDGLALVNAVRAESGRVVPVIVVSGARAENDIVRAFDAGAVDFLPKPFKPDELLARCAVHLARATEFGAQGGEEGPLPEKGGLVFGRYKIQSELGRGGYGRVYLATDEQRGKALVALKVLSALSGESMETRLRFVRETYALSGIRDPRVVRVHDVGTFQGRLYFAMEYVEGISLGSHISRYGCLSEVETRELMRGLLEALVALEQIGIVHRDLKPANVILRSGQTREPVLLDFGLAKRQGDRGITQPDVVVGTVSYLAPEVVRGWDFDRRSDLFALGLTLRYALTGEEVFPTLAGVDLMTAMASVPIAAVEHGISAPFSAFLASLWNRDPSQRPRSAEAALERLASLESVVPATAPYRRPPTNLALSERSTPVPKLMEI